MQTKLTHFKAPTPNFSNTIKTAPPLIARADGAPGGYQPAGPQDSVQLSQAVTNPLASLSHEQVINKAFEGKDAAVVQMGALHEGITDLPKADQKAIGQSMFYEVASATGYYQTESESGMRNMTAGELRKEAPELSDADRKSFEADVQGWASENEVLSQLAMARGAATWAWSESTFGTVESEARKDQLLGISQSAQGVWQANNQILDSATEINRRSPGVGTGLFQALNEPQE